MLEGLYSAAAGMSAQQQQMDAISNDLANASTTGYKAQRIGFRDLLYNEVNEAGTTTTAGAGAAAQLLGRNEAQGAIQETGNPLDLAIEGEGYFQVKRPDGTVALTRNGTFGIDSQGRLTNDQGNLLDPPITVPKGTQPSELSIASDGTVTGPAGRALGRIALVTVGSPEHLAAAGSSEFLANAASGNPQLASGGSIRQGALEGSNVDLATEMVQMVTTQRSYQMTSSAIQTENQMLSIANELRS
jgi:flagellar basal-body rod protein FlgG